MIPNNINARNKLLAHSLLEGKKVIRRGSLIYRDENLIFVCVRMHTWDDFRLNWENENSDVFFGSHRLQPKGWAVELLSRTSRKGSMIQLSKCRLSILTESIQSRVQALHALKEMLRPYMRWVLEHILRTILSTSTHWLMIISLK
jgi:hypothetical protein